MKKIVLLVAAVALVLGYLYYRSLVSGPEYSLLQAKEAAQSHNVAEFEKYVHVESLSNSLVDEVIAVPGLSGNFIPGLSIDKSMLQFLKPPLAKAVRTEVRTYVETGKLNPDLQENVLLLPLAALAGTFANQQSQFKDIAYVKKSGDEALVGLEFTQPQFDTTIVLEIKMLDKGTYWQATEFTNAGQLLKNMLRQQKNIQNF